MKSIVVLGQHGRETALLVLHAMALVDDNVIPRNLAEHTLVVDDRLVLADDDVEATRIRELGLVERLACALVALVRDGLDRRRPLGKLVGPVRERAERHDDQERAVVELLLLEVRHESDGLNRLAETHLVGQDAVQPVVVQRHEPLDAEQLVRLQRAAREKTRLLLDLLLDAVRHGVVGLGLGCLGRSVALLAVGAGLGLGHLLLDLHRDLVEHLALLGGRLAPERELGSLESELLLLDQVANLVEILIGLAQQLVQAVVLGLLQQHNVGILVVFLQGRTREREIPSSWCLSCLFVCCGCVNVHEERADAPFARARVAFVLVVLWSYGT